jgi:hypothetical protein
MDANIAANPHIGQVKFVILTIARCWSMACLDPVHIFMGGMIELDGRSSFTYVLGDRAGFRLPASLAPSRRLQIFLMKRASHVSSVTPAGAACLNWPASTVLRHV